MALKKITGEKVHLVLLQRTFVVVWEECSLDEMNLRKDLSSVSRWSYKSLQQLFSQSFLKI